MSAAKAIAFWLFVYLAISSVLSSILVLAGRAPAFPVFQTFEATPVAWRIAFFTSGLLAALTAYLLRRDKKVSALSATAFLALFFPSYKVVWGQLALGSWIAVLATALAMFLALRNRNGV